MFLWSSFVELLRVALFAFAHVCGGSLGGGIIALSLMIRLALLPLTLRIALRAHAHQRLMQTLKPEIDRLQRRHANNPLALARSTRALHARHGVEFPPRGTFLGDRRVRAHQAACEDWPRADVPKDFLDPVTSDIPTVLYSGEADGATPDWIAAAAVRFLANGRQIHVPHMGHQLAGPCSWDLMRDFIAHPSVRDLDASCAAGVKRPPFATEIPPMR